MQSNKFILKVLSFKFIIFTFCRNWHDMKSVSHSMPHATGYETSCDNFEQWLSLITTINCLAQCSIGNTFSQWLCGFHPTLCKYNPRQVVCWHLPLSPNSLSLTWFSYVEGVSGSLGLRLDCELEGCPLILKVDHSSHRKLTRTDIRMQ